MSNCRHHGFVELTCSECKTQFNRPVSVQKRNVDRGVSLHFCCKKCSGRYKIKNTFKDRKLWKTTGTKLNEFSPFRSAMKKCRSRKKWHTDITVEYLLELWKFQNGKCALSGLPMGPLPEKVSKSYRNGPRAPFKPSLDRIDSKLGYEIGNVQWVCTIVNLAKANFEEEDLFTMCRAVTELQQQNTQIP